MDAQLAHEVERAITAALSRRGIAGTVVVREGCAELHAPNTPVLAIELEWLAQWNVLPPDLQEKRAEHAAQRLQSALVEARGSKVVASIDFGPLVRKGLVAALLLGAAGAAGWWLWQAGFFGRASGAADVPSPSATQREQAADDGERRRRACEAARRRLYAGASMGMDVEGWIVELWLARPVDRGQLAVDASLLRGVEQARAAFEAPAEMRVVRGERAGALGMESALVRMEGAFVSAFFDARGHARIQELADDLAVAADAHHGALFARCEHLATRDVGAWFAGRDEGGALVSLIHALGGFADPPAYDRGALSDGALPALAARVQELDRGATAKQLERFGGRFDEVGAGADAGVHHAALRFAFGGPTHAVKASRAMAAELDLAP